MAKLYISDLHFFHDHIITKENRPFTSELEMRNLIIKNWKEKVKDTDTVYVLGDVGMYHVYEIADILKSLPGEKVLVTGNHDIKNLEHRTFRNCFVKIRSYTEIDDGGRHVVLCHYPIEDWNGKWTGAYHLHGHVHKFFAENLAKREHRYNVSADILGYTPVTLDELLKEDSPKGSNNMLTKEDATKLFVEMREFLVSKGLIDGNVVSSHLEFRDATSYLGKCYVERRRDGYVKSAHIILSTNFLVSTQTVRDTLAHEFVHTLQGCQNHGPNFKSKARVFEKVLGVKIDSKANINDFGEDEAELIQASLASTAKYKIVCESCGKVGFRQKASSLVKHPEKYRCSCGGKIHVEKL